MAPEVTILQASNAVLGEGPIWDAAQGAFYWADLKRFNIYRYDLDEGQTAVWPLPLQFGCFALRADGGMCVVTDNGFETLDLASGQLTHVVDPEAEMGFDHCYNDGKVDPQGRFWVGSLPMAGARNEEITENSGRLYSLSPDGSVTNHYGGLYVSNGMGWSPDSTVMYHIDSFRGSVFARDFDPVSGTLGAERVHHSFVPEDDGYPDGMTVDADGNLWIAMWDGWKIVNISASGERLGEIAMPVQKPTSCCFGGPDLDVLFITSASAYLTSTDLAKGPQAGAIMAAKPGVRGLPSKRFKG